MSDLIQRNVVLIPKGQGTSRLMAEAAEMWSQDLAESFATEFVLGKGNLTHMSVYQAAYPVGVEPKLVAALEWIAENTAEFPLVSTDLGIFWETFVFWDMQPTAPFINLYKRCVDRLNPLREGRLTPIQESLLDDPAMADYADAIREYGHPLSGIHVRPHITLTRLKQAQDMPGALELVRRKAKASDVYGIRGLRSFVDKICLTEVGPHGTCSKILAEYPFRKK